MRMKNKGLDVFPGMIIKFVVTKGKGLIRDKVKLLHEAGQYNIEYYLNKQILPAVENIFQVFNIDIKELIEGKKQMTLGDF